MSIVDRGEYKRSPQLASGEFFMNPLYSREPLCGEAEAALCFLMDNFKSPSVGCLLAYVEPSPLSADRAED